MSLLLFRPSTEVEPAPEPAPAPVGERIHPVRTILEFSFNDPGAVPLWVDETDYLKGYSTRSGRNTPLDKFEASEANITLHNWDGRFDSNNTGGAHYPNIKPVRRVRLKAEVDTGADAFLVGDSFVGDGDVLGGGLIEYPLFTGFIEAWPQDWDANGFDPVVLITAVDAFAVFALPDFTWGDRYVTLDPGPNDWPCGTPTGTNVTPATGTPHPPDELTGARIVRVLDCVNWPASDRELDAGQIIVLGSDGTNNFFASSKALAQLLDAANTEGGALFMGPDGRVVFRDSANDPPLDPADVFGNGAGEHPIRAGGAPFDMKQLWNKIVVTTTESELATATVTDATSIEHYYERPLKTVTLLPTAGANITARADSLLARYAEPRQRIEVLEPLAITADEWVNIIRRGLLGKIRVKVQPEGGALVTQDSAIEGIDVQSDDEFDFHVFWRISELVA